MSETPDGTVETQLDGATVVEVVPIQAAIAAADTTGSEDWEEIKTVAAQIAADDAEPSAVAHLCSNGHECTCPDIPSGGHSCGRTPESEPDSPLAEELARAERGKK